MQPAVSKRDRICSRHAFQCSTPKPVPSMQPVHLINLAYLPVLLPVSASSTPLYMTSKHGYRLCCERRPENDLGLRKAAHICCPGLTTMEIMSTDKNFQYTFSFMSKTFDREEMASQTTKQRQITLDFLRARHSSNQRLKRHHASVKSLSGYASTVTESFRMECRWKCGHATGEKASVISLTKELWMLTHNSCQVVHLLQLLLQRDLRVLRFRNNRFIHRVLPNDCSTLLAHFDTKRQEL